MTATVTSLDQMRTAKVLVRSGESDAAGLIRRCLDRPKLLTDQETGLLRDFWYRCPLTPWQRATLDAIAVRVLAQPGGQV